MTVNKKISGLIITYNEEKNIKSVIENMDFVDEIIIIDSFSTDNTLTILKDYPKIKVFQNKFEDYTKQRNLAIEKASNNWILFLDADERITPKLKQEILEEIEKEHTKDAYYFKRKFYYNQTPIHFSGTQTDKNYRLFKKNKAKYIQDKLVHETLFVKGETGILKHKLLHYSFDDYQIYKSKMLSYGRLKGKEIFLKGKKYSIFTQYGKTIFKFFKTYFLRLGILDGYKGFNLSYLQTLSVFETYRELKKLSS